MDVNGFKIPGPDEKIDIHTPERDSHDDLKEGDRILITLLPRGDGTKGTFTCFSEIGGQQYLTMKCYGEQYISTQSILVASIRSICTLPYHVWLGFECMDEYLEADRTKGQQNRKTIKEDAEMIFKSVRNDGLILLPEMISPDMLKKLSRS